MSNKISFEFKYGKDVIKVEQDGKVKGKFDNKSDNKKIRIFLDAILGEDKKLNNPKEIELMQKLQSVFGNKKDINSADLELADEFIESGYDIEKFLDEKIEGKNLDIDEFFIGVSPPSNQPEPQKDIHLESVKIDRKIK